MVRRAVHLKTTLATGPFRPRGSRYSEVPDARRTQPAPPRVHTPPGRTKRRVAEVVPTATMSIVAPFAIGSPTRVSGLEGSRAWTTIRRETESPDSLHIIRSRRPRTVGHDRGKRRPREPTARAPHAE